MYLLFFRSNDEKLEVELLDYRYVMQCFVECDKDGFQTKQSHLLPTSCLNGS